MMRHDIPEHLAEGHVNDFDIVRVKKGNTFKYYFKDDTAVPKNLQKQVQAYGVPNTWTEVCLCKNGDTHILASGYDGSDKLQYLYHPDYLEYRNSLKFLELSDFGLTLPRIRRKINQHLKSEEWNEEKLLALIVKILDKHYVRIGTRAYAKKNSSFGLTTLRKKHLNETAHGLSFEYIGKSHQNRKIELHDTELIEHIKEVVDFPGWEIFSFKKGGKSVKASSSMVNEYIRTISKSEFSAKTFRTWGGTSSAVKLHAKAQSIVAKNTRKELGATLVQLVSERLGNTPSICKQYYIHPQVLEATLQPNFNTKPKKGGTFDKNYLNKSEQRTLEILNAVNSIT